MRESKLRSHRIIFSWMIRKEKNPSRYTFFSIVHSTIYRNRKFTSTSPKYVIKNDLASMHALIIHIKEIQVINRSEVSPAVVCIVGISKCDLNWLLGELGRQRMCRHAGSKLLLNFSGTWGKYSPFLQGWWHSRGWKRFPTSGWTYFRGLVTKELFFWCFFGFESGHQICFLFLFHRLTMITRICSNCLLCN